MVVGESPNRNYVLDQCVYAPGAPESEVTRFINLGLCYRLNINCKKHSDV